MLELALDRVPINVLGFDWAWHGEWPESSDEQEKENAELLEIPLRLQSGRWATSHSWRH